MSTPQGGKHAPPLSRQFGLMVELHLADAAGLGHGDLHPMVFLFAVDYKECGEREPRAGAGPAHADRRLIRLPFHPVLQVQQAFGGLLAVQCPSCVHLAPCEF